MAEGKKITQKVLSENCRMANNSVLKALSWGLRVDQVAVDGVYHYALKRISRKSSSDMNVLVSGTPKEIAAAIEAVVTLVDIERSKQS